MRLYGCSIARRRVNDHDTLFLKSNMAKYSKERKDEHVAIVRSIMVRNPSITVRECQSVLASLKVPLVLDRNYVNKLMRNVHRDRAFRLNQKTLSDLLSKFEDETEEMKQKLWSIVLDLNAVDKDKIAAMKELRQMSSTLIDRMFDAGVFERNLGKIKTESDLTKDEEIAISRALRYAKATETEETIGDDESGGDGVGTRPAQA
jgi:hypothetical protein